MKKLNIISNSKDPVSKVLSNLAYTPFIYGGYKFPSVESVLQGIKFKDEKNRLKVFKMKGLDALKSGRKLNQVESKGKRYIYWDNKRVLYNSDQHRLLIACFIKEKVRQNLSVQKALISTEKFFIYHDAGQEDLKTSLPEKLFIEILLSERRILLRLKKLK